MTSIVSMAKKRKQENLYAVILTIAVSMIAPFFVIGKLNP
jgi:hypothetical protein